MPIIARILSLISLLLFSLDSFGQDNSIILKKSDSSQIRYYEMLNYFQLLKDKDSTFKNIDTLPFYYNAKGIPYLRPKPLPIDTIAPLWTLISLTNEKINLYDLKGQIVLLDFFYKRCPPCVEGLPFLQAFHEKYKDKGLRVIGIDPYDTRDEAIIQFMVKYGVTFPILLEGDVAVKKYRISGYPTIYLIDRNGIVIYTLEGTGKEAYKKLEEIIEKNLL